MSDDSRKHSEQCGRELSLVMMPSMLESEAWSPDPCLPFSCCPRFDIKVRFGYVHHADWGVRVSLGYSSSASLRSAKIPKGAIE